MVKFQVGDIVLYKHTFAQYFRNDHYKIIEIKNKCYRVSCLDSPGPIYYFTENQCILVKKASSDDALLTPEEWFDIQRARM